MDGVVVTITVGDSGLTLAGPPLSSVPHAHAAHIVKIQDRVAALYRQEVAAQQIKKERKRHEA